MESLECRHVAPRPWASHFTFLGLPFLADTVEIMTKLSQKVMETGRVSPWYVVKYTKRARVYGDLGLHLGHTHLVPKVSLFPHPPKFSSDSPAYHAVVKSTVPSPGTQNNKEPKSEFKSNSVTLGNSVPHLLQLENEDNDSMVCTESWCRLHE